MLHNIFAYILQFPAALSMNTLFIASLNNLSEWQIQNIKSRYYVTFFKYGGYMANQLRGLKF